MPGLYLVKHGLAEGHSTSTAGGYQVWANHITGSGMDVVERLIENSVEQVIQKKISFKNKISSYSQQFSELLIIWSKNPDLLNNAYDYLLKLIETLI